MKLRSSLDGSDSKHLDADLYRPLIGVARANEKRLREKHLKDGTQFPDDNPSTSIGLFAVLVGSVGFGAVSGG